MKKYLSDHTLNWLLEEENPHIRYVTLRDILGRDIRSEEMLREYEKLRAAKESMRFFTSERNGIMGNSTNFDIYYRGAMWCFAEAVEYGYDVREEVMRKTAEYIMNRSQMQSGGFTLNWKPEVEVACRTGDMTKYLILAGSHDERIERGIEWILKHQRHDGGWLHCPLAGTCDLIKFLLFRRSGSGLEREGDSDIPSCLYASIACSMALVHYDKEFPEKRSSLERAAEFFLEQRMFLNTKPSRKHISTIRKTDVTRLGYPVLSQYDILYGLIFIARAGYFNDNRTGGAFNLIISKQHVDGVWMMESAQTGMLFGDVKKKTVLGKRSKWVTLNVMRMLKHADLEKF
jgi:hypothetical protein